MKDLFNKYWKALEETGNELQSFLEEGGLSSLSIAKSKKLICAWNKQKKLATELDQFITPVEALEVKIPYASTEFTDMWQRWKDYLSEQWGQLMRSRAEVSALEYLDKISNADEAKAIYILRYAMANRYRNFFAIDEKDAKQPAKEEPAGKGSGYG